MKKENDCWIDENDNRWNSKLCSEEEAIEASETLINCSNCRDCYNCEYEIFNLNYIGEES
jgi:hypothetical protein